MPVSASTFMRGQTGWRETVACNTNRHKCVGNVLFLYCSDNIQRTDPEAVHPHEMLLYLIILHYQHLVV